MEKTLTNLEMVALLSDQLTRKNVAFSLGLSDTEQLANPTTFDELTTSKLRTLHEAASIFLDYYDNKTAIAWLLGTNSRLNNNAPASVLRDATNKETLQDVLAAAQSFGSMG